MVRWLLAVDANPLLPDSNGSIALEHARENNHDDVVYLLELAQMPSWDVMAKTEKAVILLQEELRAGTPLGVALQSKKHSHLQAIIVENSSFPDDTWFLIHKRFLLGYGEDNQLRWLINGKIKTSLW